MTWLPLIALIAAAEPIAQDVVLTAERVLHDTRRELSTAEGSAFLSTDGAALSADRITYDRQTDTATAAGHVVARLAQSGLVSIEGDVVTLRFEGSEVREVFVHEGRAISRSGVTREVFLSLDTPEKLAAAKPVMLLEGNHFVHRGSTWQVEQVSLTPCDCDVSNPSWAIRARTADIDLDARRATLWLPVAGPHAASWGVPFTLGLPISIPLSDRQTGLLFPKLTFAGNSGFGVETPVFITLGRSADLTITPGYFGGAFTSADGGWPTTPTTTGIQGPRLNTEFRYAPAQDVSGRVVLGLLYDLKRTRDPVDANATDGGMRGLRGEASWSHVQNFGHGFGARVEAQAHSDGYYWRDGVIDVVAREAGYLRSTANVFHKGPGHLVSLETTLRQDIQWGYDLFRPTALLPTTPTFGPNTLQRLPAVTLSVPTTPLVGPLAVDLEADFVRLAPLSGKTGDEGVLANEGRTFDGGVELTAEQLRTNLYLPSGDKRDAGMGDGVYQPGERQPRDRLNLFPRLWATWRPGDVMSVAAWVGWRQNVWLSETTGAFDWRGYPVASLRGETELAGRFGAFEHVIRPSVELRTVPVVLRSSDIAPYDEVDRSVVDATAHVQLVAELSQRLLHREAGGVTESLRLDVGQGVELLNPHWGELYGRLSGRVAWLSGSVQARFDPAQNLLTRLSASAGLDTGTGWGASASYENLLDDGTNRTRQPLDLLFGAPVPVGAALPSRAQLLSAQARARISTVSLRYEALFLNRDWSLTPVPDQRLTFGQHTLGVGWSPNCDCFRLEATVSQQFNVTKSVLTLSNTTFPFLNFGFTFSVSRFGAFGS